MTQLERYLQFSKRAWGALANVSLLFPFAPALSESLRIPVAYQLITAVFCAGAVLTAWVGRPVYWLRELRGNRVLTLGNVGSALLAAGISFIFAFVLISLDPLEALPALPPALYLLGFSFLSAGFAMLGLKEYFLTEQDFGFDPLAMRERIVQMQLTNLARNYIRARPKDLRVTQLETDSRGIRLIVQVGAGEEYDVQINGRGAIDSFKKLHAAQSGADTIPST